nr:hypothetical protein [Tanacetum cinerariifolium]
MDAERIKALRKRTRKGNVEKDETAKKQKGDELEKEKAKKQKLEEQQEAKELKRNLEIVPDDEDDEGKKDHIQIIRANRNHQMYLAFSTMRKNFDREDLEVLWKIVKDRLRGVWLCFQVPYSVAWCVSAICRVQGYGGDLQRDNDLQSCFQSDNDLQSSRFQPVNDLQISRLWHCK